MGLQGPAGNEEGRRDGSVGGGGDVGDGGEAMRLDGCTSARRRHVVVGEVGVAARARNRGTGVGVTKAAAGHGTRETDEGDMA